MPGTINNLKIDAPIRSALEDARRALREVYGDRLRRLIVFGSQARGEADEESDVDVLIVLGGPVDPLEEARRTSGVIIDAAVNHGVALSFVHLSEEEFSHQDRPLLRNVWREGVAL